MKRLVLALVLAGWASAPKAPVETSSATVTPPKEDEAPAPVEKEQPREALDPLAVGGALEAASIPKIEQTPSKELRPKSRADLEAAMSMVKNESTLDGAVKRVTQRLGKATWTEDGKKRIWVAKDGKACHRF